MGPAQNVLRFAAFGDFNPESRVRRRLLKAFGLGVALTHSPFPLASMIRAGAAALRSDSPHRWHWSAPATAD